MQKNKILITCAKGSPPFLKQELSALRFPIVGESLAAVETEGVPEDALRLNLGLRTAHRVLFLVREFAASSAEDLYRNLSAIKWEELLPDDGYLCVTTSIDTRCIRDPRFAALRTKDAVVDRMREKRGKRPDSGPERDRSVLHLYWKDEHCAVYLDTSGEPLSRRGYRKIPLAAPMQETLAAAVVLATGWKGEGAFVNPMCGSGTLAVEAALLGLNRAPGLLRENFGFMHLNGYDQALWNDVRGRAKSEARKDLPGRIIATDCDPGAVAAARKNANTAGVEHLIEFHICDYAETPLPDGKGVIVMNPPYGERMGEMAALQATYKGIGDFFKQKCEGYTGFVFTGNPALAKKVGLKPARAVPLFNSGIECRLLEYDIYEGSRKARKQKTSSGREPA